MRAAGSRGRNWGAMVVALLLLGSTIGITPGQEATGEISVTVRPAGTIVTSPEPTDSAPATAPTPAAGTSATDPAPAQGGAGDALANTPASMPGTVTAHLELHAGEPSVPSALPTLLVVRDDRGTAAGWTVVLAATEGSEPVPALLVNQPGTIVRILPAGPVAIREGEVIVGRTLGVLAAPVRVLHAAPSGGAGLYTQQLVIRYPGLAVDVAPVPLFVIQLPSAP